jgi:hypothetical protein
MYMYVLIPFHPPPPPLNHHTHTHIHIHHIHRDAPKEDFYSTILDLLSDSQWKLPKSGPGSVATGSETASLADTDL